MEVRSDVLAKPGLLSGLTHSELWVFLAGAFRNYPQFILAFIASSGFISVFVYLMRFGLNAIDIISTSDIIFNTIANLFLLVPLYAVIAIMAAIWVGIDEALDASVKDHKGPFVVFLAVFKYGRTALLAIAVVVALIGMAALIWAYLNAPEAWQSGIAALQDDFAFWGRQRWLGFTALDGFGLSVGILAVWLLPLIYKHLTAGVLPKGLLTAVVVFVVSNIIIGNGAYGLYGLSSNRDGLGFMRRQASNLPSQIETACAGERDIVWTGDKALVILCRANGHRFVFYREYGTVVEMP